jgi:hypothetical protein
MAITEDYVSFETAKLLKEKGFDQNCATYYLDGQVWRHYSGEVIPKGKQIYAAPTQAIVMKWLRKVHNIYIDISPTYSEVEKTIHFIWQIFDSNYDGVGDCEIFYDKYEIACEEAITYCLENLI